MMKYILIGILALLAIFFVIAMLQPADFRITRTATVAAPPAALFEQINHFHRWNEWSPWAKLDPNATYSFEGEPSGPGASYTWAGNREVGEGRMTITESRPNEVIIIKMDFIKPFAGTNTTEFTFQPRETGTAVTWSMSGKNGFTGKVMSLFIDYDKMVGGMFEKGFENLKMAVESKPAA